MIQSPKVLIGASIPRSGHHFLQNLMTRFFGSDLHYCEFYSVKDCCKTFPCTKRGDFPVLFQKSHDREMEVPKDIASATYVLQYRHPVPEALSDRELDLIDSFGRAALNYRLSREHYAQWLASKAVYYRRYHDKWLWNRVPNGIYLDYDYLSAQPVDAMEQLVVAATGHADRARIEAVVDEAKSVRVSTSTKGTTTFKKRVISDSPHFDAELLGAFEDYVLERSPRYGYERMLTGSYKGTLLHGLILAIDETEPVPAGFTDRLDAAASLAGEHPDIMIRMAQRDQRNGRSDAAATRLQKVVADHPYCSAAYKPLFAAHRAQKTAPPAELFGGDAILGMAGRPEALIDAGKVLLDGGQVVNAVSALMLAATILPDNAKANHFLATAMLKAGRPRQALPYAEAAARLEANSAPYGNLVGAIRKRLGVQLAA